MYFLSPHWMPAMWRSPAQTSIRAEFLSENIPHADPAADLPAQSLNHIAGADACPVFAGKVAVSQCLINAILDFLGGLLHLHRLNSTIVFACSREAILLSCAWIAFFTLTPKLWIEQTKVIGIVSK